MHYLNNLMLFGNNLYSIFHYNKLAQEKLKQLELNLTKCY
jgi:hypothetical protein